jgi:hypothetical protein
MRHRAHRSLLVSVCLFGLVAEGTTQPAAVRPAAAPAAGLLRSELSLAGHTVTIAFSPALRADDSAHKSVISADGTGTARVRVAELHTTGSLRIATLALGKDDPAGLRYSVWLEGTSEGWQLQLTDAQDSPSSVVGSVALARQAAAAASPTFVMALLPVAKDLARLVLRWGPYEGTVDLQFTDPPRRRQTERTPANVTTNRAHDEDTSVLSRARLLAQRGETALALPDGRRLSVSFARQGLEVDGLDFPRVASAAAGVIPLTESPVPRLRIEAPIRFGSTTLRTGNQGAGQPGSYGLWLKRVGDSWRLVFNNEPDVWGSQHDSKFDAAEIAVTHTQGHIASRPFAVALVPTAPDRGRLVIVWGPHDWSADFVVTS